jgi:hypothetical protein
MGNLLATRVWYENSYLPLWLVNGYRMQNHFKQTYERKTYTKNRITIS